MKEIILNVLNQWNLNNQELIAEQIIHAVESAPRFYLYKGNTYVERTGESEPDAYEGVFYSLKELNDYVQRNWFDFGIDMRGKFFTEEITRFQEKEKNCWSDCYVYYEIG